MTKAFEIAMQIDNKLLEKQVKESDLEKSGSGSIGIESSNTLIGKIFSGLSGSASFSASKSDRTEDTLKVISTKSTILAPVIQKSVEVKKLGDDRINIEDILDEIQGQLKVIVSEEIYEKARKARKARKDIAFRDIFYNFKYIDLSLLMLGENERVDAWLQPAIILAQQYLQNYMDSNVVFIIDKRYVRNVVQNLPYFFSSSESLEKLIGLDQRNITGDLLSGKSLICAAAYENMSHGKEAL